MPDTPRDEAQALRLAIFLAFRDANNAVEETEPREIVGMRKAATAGMTRRARVTFIVRLFLSFP